MSTFPLETAAHPEQLRRVVIEPLSRVEGHGKVTLLMDEDDHPAIPVDTLTAEALLARLDDWLPPLPGTLTRPAVGWGSSWRMSRASTCGSPAGVGLSQSLTGTNIRVGGLAVMP